MRNIYNKSGVYQVKCNECPLRFIGHTGSLFTPRHKEHIQATKANKQVTQYAQHILDTGHTYSTMEEIMDVLHIKQKGQLLNT
jgi:hypothetical protein